MAMTFGQGVGASALGGGMEHMFQSADSLHTFEAEQPAAWVLDPLGSAFGAVLGHSERSKAKKQRKYAQQLAEMQYQYQKRAALEMPALYRQGFEDAGYNALLALGNTGGATSAVSPSDGSAYPHENRRRVTKIDPLFLSAIENQKAQRRALDAQTTKTKVDTALDVIKTVGGTLTSAVGLGFAYKKLKNLLGGSLGAKGVDALKEIPLHKMVTPKDAVAPSGSSALSTAAGAGASAFTKAIAPASVALGYTALQMALGKALEPDKEVKVNANTLRHRTGRASSPRVNRKHN